MVIPKQPAHDNRWEGPGALRQSKYAPFKHLGPGSGEVGDGGRRMQGGS